MRPLKNLRSKPSACGSSIRSYGVAMAQARAARLPKPSRKPCALRFGRTGSRAAPADLCRSKRGAQVVGDEPPLWRDHPKPIEPGNHRVGLGHYAEHAVLDGHHVYGRGVRVGVTTGAGVLDEQTLKVAVASFPQG